MPGGRGKQPKLCLRPPAGGTDAESTGTNREQPIANPDRGGTAPPCHEPHSWLFRVSCLTLLDSLAGHVPARCV